MCELVGVGALEGAVLGARRHVFNPVHRFRFSPRDIPSAQPVVRLTSRNPEAPRLSGGAALERGSGAPNSDERVLQNLFSDAAVFGELRDITKERAFQTVIQAAQGVAIAGGHLCKENAFRFRSSGGLGV